MYNYCNSSIIFTKFLFSWRKLNGNEKWNVLKINKYLIHIMCKENIKVIYIGNESNFTVFSSET